MRSLRTKITSLTIAAVLLCALLIGAVSTMTVKTLEEGTSQQLMNVVCDAECDKINHYLTSVEDIARPLSQFAFDDLEAAALYEGGVIGANGSGRSLCCKCRTPEQSERLDSYLRGHLERTAAMFHTLVSGNSSVLDYYYYINPELSGEVRGFWYSRHEGVRFRSLELTDLADYSPDDRDHVGWYYITLERGRPSWLDPYENANLHQEVVSYTVPIFKAGTFVGLIGLDISYSNLAEQINALEVLNTGYAFLTDARGKIVCHPMLESGALLGDVNTQLDKDQWDDSALLHYTFNGVSKRAATGTLRNGLRLFVSAPASELSTGWRRLFQFIMLSATAILGLFITLTLKLMSYIIRPLERLAQASQQLSSGNYDVELGYAGDDEVGTLTQSFQQMARDMRAFVQDLNSKAYSDALTGVRNKGAFTIFTRKLDESIHSEEASQRPAFALAMFDCNELKVINDTYGHEKGDVYLRTACQTICKVFVHSPVFRIGGDEFAAVLQGEDLLNRLDLERQLVHRIQDLNQCTECAWEKVDLAWGIEEYDHSRDRDLESVLRRADQRMYEHKKRIKQDRRTG